jgi:oligopeptide transport system substrate-binding protein
MNSFIKKIALFSILAATATGSSQAAIHKAAPLKVISIHLPGEPASLDWNLSNRRIDNLIINNLQVGLVDAGPAHQLLPVLAKSWDISADGKTYTFHLRPGLQWSDGKALVAQNFIDSWKRLLSPVTSTSNGYFLLEIEGAENFRKGRETDFSNVAIKALDPLTIQIKLRRPLWNWVWNFAETATFPIRQDLVDQYGSKAWASPGNMVTMGPYNLVSHDLDSEYVLKKNPRYFRALTIKIDEIDYKILTETEAIQTFLAGKLDLICYVATVEKLPKEALAFLHWTQANTTKRLDFNTQRFPISNPQIREAIALAIDRRKLIQGAGAGLTRATSAAPPAMTAHFNDVTLKPDPVKGRELVWNAHLENLSIELLVPMFDEHSDENLKTAQLIRQMLTQELHADVTLQRAETEQLYSLLRDTQQYSLLIRDWTGTIDPDEFYSFYASFSRKSTSWSDPAYDKLVEQSRYEKNATKRMKLYREMDEMLTQKNFAVLPLYYSADGILVGRRVEGFNADSLDPCKIRAQSLK